MYVCVYVYICVYIHIYAYAHTHVYTFGIIYIFALSMNTCICVFISLHINNVKKIKYGNLEIKLLNCLMENFTQ